MFVVVVVVVVAVTPSSSSVVSSLAAAAAWTGSEGEGSVLATVCGGEVELIFVFEVSAAATDSGTDAKGISSRLLAVVKTSSVKSAGSLPTFGVKAEVALPSPDEG